MESQNMTGSMVGNVTRTPRDNISSFYTEDVWACWALNVPPEKCQNPTFTVVTMGYIYPALAILTTIINIFSFVIFTRYSRSATWIFLAGIAMADTGTALSPVVHYIYLYGMDNFRSLMPCSWSSTHFISTEFLPLCFHVASIIMTTLLCIQRYVCVCLPFAAKSYFSAPQTMACVVVAFVLGVLVNCDAVFSLDGSYRDISLLTSANSNTTHEMVFCSWGVNLSRVHNTTHEILHVVLLEILPCSVITVLTIRIIRHLKISHRFRAESSLNDDSTKQMGTETRQVTLMLVAIMILFLITETPFVFFLAMVTTKRYYDDIITNDSLYEMIVIQNLIVLVNCHCNFWIYCSMSKKFRLSIKRIVVCNRDMDSKRDNDVPNTATTRMSWSSSRKSSETEREKH